MNIFKNKELIYVDNYPGFTKILNVLLDSIEGNIENRKFTFYFTEKELSKFNEERKIYPEVFEGEELDEFPYTLIAPHGMKVTIDLLTNKLKNQYNGTETGY